MQELGDGTAKASIHVSVGDDGVALVTLAGELDISNVDQAREAMTEIIGRRPKCLLIDLAGITFLDSSGLALLVFARREVGSIEVRRPSDSARRAIEATGLSESLGMTP